MIHVEKTERNIPDSLKKDSCLDNLKKVIDLSNLKHKDNISEYFYGTKSDVPSKLKNLYNNKCAYCENKNENDIEVDHYRPKNAVKNEKHKGYYWLCYEWTNLLPACHVCNKANFKGTNFPIEGTRVLHPIYNVNKEIDFGSSKLDSDYLKTEKPLLLNPEMKEFNPFNYYEISKCGLFKEKQPNNSFEFRQANNTIEILGFNKRTCLFSYRKQHIRYLFYKHLKPALKKLFLTKNVDEFKSTVFSELKTIKANSNPTKEYSFFWLYLYNNFTVFVCYYFKGKHRNPFFYIYKEFISQYP